MAETLLANRTGKDVLVYDSGGARRHWPRLEAIVTRGKEVPLSRHPAWPAILEQGMRQTPLYLEAVEGNRTAGWLPLLHVESLLFGRFLVSLPYLNYGGVQADDEPTARRLIDRAILLADELKVRYLELRHEHPVEHPALTGRLTSKVHMRLDLPRTEEELWRQIPSKVRNQVRKGQRQGFLITWGREELLPDFYAVFSQTMRDLGTPVYGHPLFRAILQTFPARAELCVVRHGAEPVASALLLHGWGVTEVPSAACLHRYHPSCANMLLYWQLLLRAVECRQAVFDFGRSTRGGNTFTFKKQWGTRPEPAVWQYYVRSGTATDMRPDGPGNRVLIRIWQHLPVWLTRLVGPAIVRGIP
jgi:FemAB-related protein (PEP-CTERM system-associated)